MKCARCGEKIEYNDYVEIDGKYYHTRCKIVPGLNYTELEKALKDVVSPNILAEEECKKYGIDTKPKVITTAIMAKTIKDAKVDFNNLKIGMSEAAYTTVLTKKPKNTIKKRKSRRKKSKRN